MQYSAPMDRLLHQVGHHVRARRQALGWTIKELAERSGLSVRFLIELEKGRGNISVGRLALVAGALNSPLASFFLSTPVAKLAARLEAMDELTLASAERALDALRASRPMLVALLGVRGAGKSTVGAQVAERLGVDFVELDARIEALAGLSLAEIFAIHGEPHYRRIEFEALSALLAEGAECVVATGGSIVAHEESWSLLREKARTLWLRADAQDLWDRVIAQGDLRPMHKNPQAFAQLQALLEARETRYAQAASIIDTSRQSLEQVVDAVVRAVAERP